MFHQRTSALLIQVWLFLHSFHKRVLSTLVGIARKEASIFFYRPVAGTGPWSRRGETVSTSRLKTRLRRIGSEKTVTSTPTSSARCRFSSALLHRHADILPAGNSWRWWFWAFSNNTSSVLYIHKSSYTVTAFTSVLNISTFHLSQYCLVCLIRCCIIS